MKIPQKYIKKRLLQRVNQNPLRKTNPRKSDEEIKEEMDRMGYEPFHIAFGRNVGKIAFRKKRVR